MISANRAQFINMSDGRNIEEAIKQIEATKGGSVDLSAYAKSGDVDKKIDAVKTGIEALSKTVADGEKAQMAEIKELSDDADLATVIKSFNALLAELIATNYMA